MRYLPNLIPENSKVLPDYFKGDLYEATKKNPLINSLMWILGIPFFLSALANIIHPLLFVLLGFIGIVLVPPGHRFIEKKLCFRLTPKIKAIIFVALFIPSLPLNNHYAGIDKQLVYQQKLQDEKSAKESVIAAHKEQQRNDSLNYYLRLSNQFSSQHKIEEANKQLQYALAFSSTSADNTLIQKEKINIASIKVDDCVKAGKYKAALPEINRLLESDPSNTELLYKRAVCYSKTGEIQEAVNNLRPLIQSGNTDAEKLHERINPIRRRVVGYETLCCDGSISQSTGRGTCSHHGGVCDWNHPIYEEYRKYE